MKFESGLQAAYTDTITKQVGPGEYTKDSDYPTVGASNGIWLASSYGNNANSGLTPALAKATWAGAKSARDASHPYIYINDSETYTISAKETFSASTAKGVVAAYAGGPLGSVDAAPILEFTNLADVWIEVTTTNDVHIAGIRFRTSGPTVASSVATALVLVQASNDLIISHNSFESEFDFAGAAPNAADAAMILFVSGNSSITANIFKGNSARLVDVSSGPGATIALSRNICYRAEGPSTPTVGISKPDLLTSFQYSSRTVNFSAAAGTATITSGSMTVNAYQGKYLYYGSAQTAFKITSNTTTILYLEDTFGDGFPSASGASVDIIARGFDAAISADLGTNVTNITQNLIISESPMDAGIKLVPEASDGTFNVADNVVINAGVSIGIVPVDSGTPAATVNLENNFATRSDAMYKICQPDGTVITAASVTITNTDAVIAPDPLVLNLALLSSAPDTDSFTSDGWLEYANAARLKRIGAKYYSSDSTVILINSPLVDAGEGVFGDDLGPWVEAVTGPTYAAGSVLEIEWPPHDMAITFEAVNPTEKANIRGDIKTFVDSWRKVFTFNFSDYANNENAWKLQTLKECLTAIQMYFIDVGTSIFTASDTLTLSGSGDSRTATPEGLTIQLIPDHWEGLQILIDGEYYYISESTASTFTLLDKRGVGFPANGSGIEFAVDSILVRAATESLNIVAPYFLNFQQGNSWMEKAFPDTLAHEYTPFSATFKEIEDIDD